MTVKQRQYLLGYLGFYGGAADGIRSAETQSAEAAFRRSFGLKEGEKTDDVLLDAVAGRRGSFWGEIRHFSRAEFRCRCGACGGFPAEPREKLVRTADRIREKLGAAAIVSSGVRCGSHNKKVGGVSGSRHLTGKAMDFRVAGVSASKLLKIAKQQPEIRYAYAIDGNYIHMDVE